MVNSYTCYIHRPMESAPNLVAVTCEDEERALVHAERAAAEEAGDWRLIEVFLGPRRVAIRERAER